ncbi:metal ABC transporter permease [Lagierella sp.]|uniref:metal ABC transporter permease n=1 Tax=Lagierella sp. TaxID=2849657 RepID=UPI00260F2B2C|nr:metal ABC transporter permease [Lagierella sp.]
MLEFRFMQRALAVSLMISIMIPLIGIVLVNRKTSMIGDALSHVSLSGVAAGLILNINPLIGGVVACVVGAFGIEGIRKKFPHYGDMATGIITALGLGIAAMLSDFAPGGNSFEAYLFGSIVSVSKMDLILISITFLLVASLSLVFYGGLLNICINPNLARLAGVNTKLINGIFTFLASLTVALSAKVIGALMVTSLIVLPVANALLISRSYKQTYIFTLLFGMFYTLSGVVLSYYFDVKPGGSIVVLAGLGLIITFVITKVKNKLRRNSKQILKRQLSS